jgi:hypothetical protein
MDIKRLQELAGITKEDINPYEDPADIQLSDKEMYDIIYRYVKDRFEEEDWSKTALRRRTVDSWEFGVEEAVTDHIERKFSVDNDEAMEYIYDLNFNYTEEGKKMLKIFRDVVEKLKPEYLPKRSNIFNPFEEKPELTDKEIYDLIMPLAMEEKEKRIDIFKIRKSLEVALEEKYPMEEDEKFDEWWEQNYFKILQIVTEVEKAAAEEKKRRAEEDKKRREMINQEVKITDQEIYDVLYKIGKKNSKDPEYPEDAMLIGLSDSKNVFVDYIKEKKFKVSEEDAKFWVLINYINRINPIRNKIRKELGDPSYKESQD